MHAVRRNHALHGLRAGHRAGGITEMVISAERMGEYSSEYYNEHFGLVEVLFSRSGGEGPASLTAGVLWTAA